MSESRPLLSRRTTLGGALLGAGLAGVAGCDGTAAPQAGRRPTGSSRTDAGPDPDSEEDVDVRLLRERLADLDAAAALVGAAVRRHDGLARPLQPLVDMHAAHRALLAGAAEGVEPDPARPPRVPRTRQEALAAVRREEERLGSRLARSAVAAESGGFARVLASMSASVTQHLAVVPR